MTKYPPRFVDWFVQAVETEVNRLSDLTDFGVDGFWDTCAKCEQAVENEAPCCQVCPRTFHATCCENFDSNGGWLCPDCALVGPLPSD